MLDIVTNKSATPVLKQESFYGKRASKNARALKRYSNFPGEQLQMTLRKRSTTTDNRTNTHQTEENESVAGTMENTKTRENTGKQFFDGQLPLKPTIPKQRVSSNSVSKSVAHFKPKKHERKGVGALGRSGPHYFYEFRDTNTPLPQHSAATATGFHSKMPQHLTRGTETGTAPEFLYKIRIPSQVLAAFEVAPQFDAQIADLSQNESPGLVFEDLDIDE